MESKYDVIILGTGESAKAAVAALKEQGKTALLIDLKPEMVTTMVCQSPQQPSHNGHPSSHMSQPVLIGDESSQIWLHKQTLHTGTSETATYTFQVHEMKETKQTDAYYSITGEEQTSSELTMIEDHEIEETDLEAEVLEANEIDAEIQSPHSFLRERENSLREKLIRREQKISPFYEDTDQETDYPVYNLERIQIEDETHSDDQSWEHPNATYVIDSGENFPGNRHSNTLSFFEQPVYRERELKLRKRLIGNQRFNGQHSHNMYPANGADKPPKIIYQEKEETNQTQNHPYQEKEKHTEDTQPGVYPLEPFSARRRARSHKKNRFARKSEHISDKKAKKPLQKSQPVTWEEPQTPDGQENKNSSFDGPLFEHSTPKIQPFKRQPFQKDTPPQSETELNNDHLKRDDIEFEDAYGGYSSLEDFLTPFSQNSRKRQEMDKIEKRKIALRGLHNLINNLG
ncbi:hypothetical protein ACFO25_10845 [Paenactinomyces guangxiensis]|uniref:Uncharacterized protein n=1 Tax=Paenactinomyces guangxiensis TaxID=1490290 RepID=A0A7W1WQE0_9BACL|nr:hypothetical protein [Paenactinomyces guangxiensis]MBA4494107.1 hypothetical protein [Paenactinomyces guangxiensis]MBH8591148.1 hypothetical protein [Paenactinomyces guangxiensis]